MSTITSPKPKIGNAELADKLAAFDYTKLHGDAWFDYLALTLGAFTNPKSRVEGSKSMGQVNRRLGGLGMNDLYVYEGWRCTAMLEHVNPDDDKSKVIMVGLQMRKDAPELPCTRITAGRAKLMNEQSPGFTQREPGLYYLLKKVPTFIAIRPVNEIGTDPNEPKKAGRPKADKAE